MLIDSLPKIGDIVTVEWGLNLCKKFKLGYLVQRLELHPELYNSWTFDGCSGLPDEVMGLFTGCRWKDITFKCCLPHDLCYAYGELGNTMERERVDLKFQSDLITKAKMKEWMAGMFLAGVRMGGAEKFGMSFSWGFAHVK